MYPGKIFGIGVESPANEKATKATSKAKAKAKSTKVVAAKKATKAKAQPQNHAITDASNIEEAAKKLLDKSGLDYTGIAGTGEGDTVTVADAKRFIKSFKP